MKYRHAHNTSTSGRQQQLVDCPLVVERSGGVDTNKYKIDKD